MQHIYQIRVDIEQDMLTPMNPGKKCVLVVS